MEAAGHLNNSMSMSPCMSMGDAQSSAADLFFIPGTGLSLDQEAAFACFNPFDHTLPLSFIGRGGNGCVFRAHGAPFGTPYDVALKYPNPDRFSHPQVFLEEFDMGCSIAQGGMNAVKPLAFWQQGVSVCIAMPCCEGDLATWEVGHRPRQSWGVAEDDLKPIFKQLIKGVSQCHDEGMAHLDLKPENVLLTDFNLGSEQSILVADLGLARTFQDADEVPGLTGTEGWRAPEMEAACGGMGPKSDTFCVGLIVYSLISGQRATLEMVHEDCQGSVLFASPKWEHVSVELKQLLLRMLSPNPAQRPDTETVLEVLEGWGWADTLPALGVCGDEWRQLALATRWTELGIRCSITEPMRSARDSFAMPCKEGVQMEELPELWRVSWAELGFICSRRVSQAGEGGSDGASIGTSALISQGSLSSDGELHQDREDHQERGEWLHCEHQLQGLEGALVNLKRCPTPDPTPRFHYSGQRRSSERGSCLDKTQTWGAKSFPSDGTPAPTIGPERAPSPVGTVLVKAGAAAEQGEQGSSSRGTGGGELEAGLECVQVGRAPRQGNRSLKDGESVGIGELSPNPGAGESASPGSAMCVLGVMDLSQPQHDLNCTPTLARSQRGWRACSLRLLRGVLKLLWAFFQPPD